MNTKHCVFTVSTALLLVAAHVAAQTRNAPAAATPKETLSQTYRGSRANDAEYQKVPPIKLFDNLYHVGPGMVSAWLVPTSDGLILIDSSWEPYVDHVIDNIRKAGFDPKNIKYIIITQGHLDHFGGAAKIQELSGARVATAEGDWRIMADYEKNPMAILPIQRVPKRDMVLKDGDRVTLGTTTLRVYVTPGHTPGVVSLEFTVYDNGVPHKAFMFGGPEPVANLGVEGAEQFLASVNRIARIPNVEVGLLVHSWLAVSTYPNGGTFERAQKLARRKPGDPNPFVDPASWRAWMAHLHVVATTFLAEQQQQTLLGPAPAQPPAVTIEGFYPDQLNPGQTTVLQVAVPGRDVIQRADISPNQGVTVSGVKLGVYAQGMTWWEVTTDVAKDAAPGNRSLVLTTATGRSSPVTVRVPNHVPMISDLRVLSAKTAGQTIDVQFAANDQGATFGDAPNVWFRMSCGKEPEVGVVQGTVAGGSVRASIPNPRTMTGVGAPTSGPRCDLELRATDAASVDSNTLKTPVEFN